jgi:quinol monooxygenase YgiN
MTTVQAFRMHIRMEVAPGTEQDFEKGWLALAQAAQEHPANLDQWLARSAEDSCVFYLVTDWTGPEGYQEFVASPGFREHIGALRAARVSDVMRPAAVLHHLRGAAAGDLRAAAS